MNNLATTAFDTCGLYAHINGYERPSTLFKSKCPIESNVEMYLSRPDIIIQERNCITVIELTGPFETNLLKLHDYKITNTEVA